LKESLVSGIYVEIKVTASGAQNHSCAPDAVTKNYVYFITVLI